jgi:hypothetical protein
MNTNNWAEFPFSVDGVNFVSKLDKAGSMYPQVSNMPVSIFNQMNQSAVRELIGKVSLMSQSEIQDELDRVNEGATQALICLA